MDTKAGGKGWRWIWVVAGAGVVVMVAIVAILYSSSPEPTPGAIPSVDSEVPRAAMVYNGTGYGGKLLGYSYGQSQSLSDIPKIDIRSIASIASDEDFDEARVQQGSQIAFAVSSATSPSGEPPDSLSVTAYTEEGDPAAVLDAREGSPSDNTYTLDLLPGRYVLITTATWLAGDDDDDGTDNDVSGYAAYGHRIVVVE
jgi:hypothetical protein